MRKTVIFFGIFLFFSCADKSSTGFEDDNPILIKVGKEADKTQLFKECFIIDNVIPIETTDEFLVGKGIQKVISYKDKLIVLDRDGAIFLVDYATGKVEFYMKKRGAGPGESRYVRDICIDEINETLIIFNDFHKLLFYDLKGNFLREEYFEKLYESTIYDNGKVLFYNNGEGYSCYPYKIEEYNVQDKTLKTIGSNYKLNFNFRLFGNHIVKSRNIWFGTPADFDLLKYSESKIESIYRLEPQASRLKNEIMELSKSDPNKFLDEMTTIMFGISSIRETAHYLVFRSSKDGIFVLNKETNEIIWEDMVHETSLGIRLMNYFPHDGDDDRIMFIIDPLEWVHLRKDANMSELPEALKEKIDSFKIDEQSNPILVFYREKY